METAVAFYQRLGLTVEYEPGSGYAVIKLPRMLHFGLWEHRTAAQSIYSEAAVEKCTPLGFTMGF